MKIPNNFGEKSPYRLTTKNAWAAYCRRRWRSNTVCEVQNEWDLSEYEARSLVYASASLATIDRVLDHRNGGLSLGLEILCLRLQTSLEAYAAKLEEEERIEREREEARREHRRRVVSRLASSASFSGEGL